MPSISVPAMVGVAGGLSAAGGIASSVIGAGAAGDAANAQIAANQQAQQLQLQMYQQTQANLSPFMSVGTSALGQLAQIYGLAAPTISPQATVNGGSALAAGGMTDAQAQALLNARPDVMAEYQRASAAADKNSPAYQRQGLDSPLNYARYWYNNMGGSASYQIPTTTAQTATGTGAAATGTGTGGNTQSLDQLLQSFPGYQFGLDQGVQALDRSAASRGLTLSGGQMKDLTSFGNQYALQQAWTPYISELNGLATSGQNAAAGLGTNATNTGSSLASLQSAQGQYGAAGILGSSNAIQSGLQSGLEAYRNYAGAYGGTPTYNLGAAGEAYSPFTTFDASGASFGDGGYSLLPNY